MIPKVVVFDLGKVLVDFDYTIATNQLAPLTSLTTAQLGSNPRLYDLLMQYEAGKITTARFFELFVQLTGYRGNLAEFRNIFGAIFSPIESMIQCQQELFKRKFPMWIFSNTNEIAVDYIRETFPFFSTFTGYIYSYAVQSMKPEPGMYEELEKRTSCSKSDFLYIDDRPENIQVGESRGWQVILHETPDKTVPQIKKAMSI